MSDKSCGHWEQHLFTLDVSDVLRKELASQGLCTRTHHVPAKEVSRLPPKRCWLPIRMQTPANLATCGKATLDAVRSCSTNNLQEQGQDHAR